MKPSNFVRLLFAGLLGLAIALPAQAFEPNPPDPQPDTGRMVVFLFIGHSNMAGRARTSDLPPHPRAWVYDLSSRPRRWVPAEARIGTDRSADRGRTGGPALPFVLSLVEEYPGYQFGIIQNARTQMTVRGYSKGQSAYNEIVTAAREVQPYAAIGGVVTMLGFMESDDNDDQTRTIAEDFERLIADLRNDLNAPELPFLITDIEHEAQTRRNDRGTQVAQRELRDLVAKVPNTALIDVTGLPYQDTHHFDMNGHWVWTTRTLAAIRRNNWIEQAWEKRAPVQRFDPALAGSATPVKTLGGEVIAVLQQTSPSVDAESIAPYRDALICHRWEIERVLSGELEPGKLVTMHYALRDLEPSPANSLQPGERYRLSLVPWETREDLHSINVSDDIMDFDATLYFVPDNALVPVTEAERQLASRRALFIVGDVRAPSSGDLAVQQRLRELGLEVRMISDRTVGDADLSKLDLILISSTVDSSNIGGALSEASVPIISNEAYLFDDLLMVAEDGFGRENNVRQVWVFPTDHPLAAGLSGQVQATGGVYSWGKPEGDAIRIATLPQDPDRAVIFAFEQGSQMANGFTAPARRVGWFLTEDTAANWTPESRQLFDAAIKWTLGV